MKEYPKLETLYDRKDDFTVDITKVRKDEFLVIKRWVISEKVDGTNIRIGLSPEGKVSIGGKTDDAQIPTSIISFVRDHENLIPPAFKKNEDTGLYPDVVIYGEGYGQKINSGGGYRNDVSVIIFDVVVDGWWLTRENVADVARKIGMDMTPDVGIVSKFPENASDITSILGGENSVVAKTSGKERVAEGIVARTDPPVYFKNGTPVMWKLKYSDFRGGKKRV